MSESEKIDLEGMTENKRTIMGWEDAEKDDNGDAKRAAPALRYNVPLPSSFPLKLRHLGAKVDLVNQDNYTTVYPGPRSHISKSIEREERLRAALTSKEGLSYMSEVLGGHGENGGGNIFPWFDGLSEHLHRGIQGLGEILGPPGHNPQPIAYLPGNNSENNPNLPPDNLGEMVEARGTYAEREERFRENIRNLMRNYPWQSDEAEQEFGNVAGFSGYIEAWKRNPAFYIGTLDDLNFHGLGRRQPTISWSTIIDKQSKGMAPVVYSDETTDSFGGMRGLSAGVSATRAYKKYTIKWVKEEKKEEGKFEAEYRFMIIDHMLLESFLGDYGAGKTIATHSLWPGEETKLYVRTWSRHEKTTTEKQSVFDSYTDKASDDLQSEISKENTQKDSASAESEEEFEAGVEVEASVNYGFGSASAKAHAKYGSTDKTKNSRESFAKSVGKATKKHASERSAKREATVSTDSVAKEEFETENIVERTVKNTNMSRVLNIISKELNQEYKTFLTLTDISVAVVSNYGWFRISPLEQSGELLGLVADKKQKGQVRGWLKGHAEGTEDYQRRKIPFSVYKGSDKWETPPRSTETNPYYPDGVEGQSPSHGIPLTKEKFTMRTGCIVMDALLGNGVGLDNYSLGRQEEVLRKDRLENSKEELIQETLRSIEDPKARAEAMAAMYGQPTPAAE
jgi:hypothetical protein